MPLIKSAVHRAASNARLAPRALQQPSRFIACASQAPTKLQRRTLTPLTIQRNSSKMSSTEFSNTSVPSDKPADPYTQKNKDEPSLSQKVEDLSTFVSANKFCMMTTRNSDGLLVSRCMALAAKESGGVDLLFHTNTESGKTDDLEAHPEINVAFMNGTGEWASISGTTKIVTDRETVRKYYSPHLKAWLGDLEDGKHDGGPEDPRIGVIKVEAKTIQYAVSRGNFVSRGVDMVKGAITGEAPAVNKLREISTSEISEYRASH